MSASDAKIRVVDADDVCRFLSRVDRSGECWLWLGGKDRAGYGKFAIRGGPHGTTVRAHRVAFFIANDRLPRRLVRHRCDNPRCVRPEHLDEGSQLQNRRDAVERGRVAAGSRHAMARLTEGQVVEIRRRYVPTVPGCTASLAREYGVSVFALYDLLSGKTWSRAGGPIWRGPRPRPRPVTGVPK